MKPRLFIGSSSESLDIAYAVQEELDHDLEVTVWSQNIFELSSGTLDTLLQSLDKFDSALFVFAPQDEVKMRGSELKAVRDNVLFEFGLFLGRLGKDRCFFLVPSGVDLHIPTDLIGITPAKYNSNRDDRNLRAAVGPACNQIRTRMKASGRVENPPTVKAEKEPASNSAPKMTEENGLLAFPDDVQIEWINAVVERSKRSERVDERTIYAELLNKLPKNFDPASIDPFFLAGSSRATVFGRALVKPGDLHVIQANSVAVGVRDILRDDPKREEIYASDLVYSTGLKEEFVSEVLESLSGAFGGGMFHNSGTRRGLQGWNSIHIDDISVFKHYMAFTSIEAILKLKCGPTPILLYRLGGPNC